MSRRGNNYDGKITFMKMTYRPDIDGLRAIAVLSVVLYHFRFRAFSGGFTGVDVFFVISGYLITKIILADLNHGGFSIAVFYERRIRRIFPALIATVCFVLVVSYYLFSPSNYLDVGKTGLATVFFGSNIYFWDTRDYFSPASYLVPLLHMWSLAVEEQFYIFFPWFMVLLHKYFRNHLAGIIFLTALTSFALNVFVLQQDPAAAFYFPHLRMWELLAGSLIALDFFPSLANDPSARNALSLAGFNLIVGSVLLLNDTTPFPGFAALMPVLGSALMIQYGASADSLFLRWISSKPMVLIGKISYSFYLWHWPVILFLKYFLIRQLTLAENSLLFAGTIVIAYFSWRFIETPFRLKTGLVNKTAFYYAGGAMLALMIWSGSIVVNSGFPERFNREQLNVISLEDAAEWQKWQTCLIDGLDLSGELALCRLGDPEAEKSFLVWGDSHAIAFAPALQRSAEKFGAAGDLAPRSACPPLIGVDRVRNYEGCSLQNNKKIIDYIQKNPELHTVILIARWAPYTEGTRYKLEDGPSITLMDESNPGGDAENPELFLIGLRNTLEVLHSLGRDVLIVSGIPEVGYNVPSAYFVAENTNRDVNRVIAPTYAEFFERNESSLMAFETLSREFENVQVLYPQEILCDEEFCYVVKDRQALYLDDNHLSVFGSNLISQIFDPVFSRINLR